MYPDFRLGSWLVQPSLNSISRNGHSTRLEPKAMEVLVCLAEADGDVVSKEKLIGEVWADTFVGDDVLVRCISELRRALEDDAKAPRVVETIPKRGYRLLEKVEPLPDSQTAHRPVLLLGIAVVVIAAAVLAGVYRADTGGPRPLLTINRLTTTGRVGLAAISRDGKFLAYSEDYLNAQTLWLREIATDTSVQLQPPAPASYKSLAFSANGAYLYYTRSAPGNSFEAPGDSFDLFRMPIVGRIPQKLRQAMPENFSISPDGKSVAFIRSDHADDEVIVVAALDGSSEREFAELHSPLSYRAGPTWSPDGKLIAAVEDDESTSLFQCRLLVIAAESGSQKMRTPSDLKYCMEQSQWLNDGRALIAPFPLPHWQIWEFTYPEGAAKRITFDSVRYGLVSLSEDPHLIVTVENDLPSSIWVGPGNDPDSANVIRHGHFLAIHGIGWTPSGEILSSTIATDTEDFVQMRSDGTDERTLPFQASTKRWPEVCPDGRTLLFHEFHVGVRTLMRADLSGFKPELIDKDVSNSGSRCSPDSKWAVYMASGKLWKMQLAGGPAILLSDKPCDFPSISHDGRWIACHYWPERASSLKLLILSLDSSLPERTLDLPGSMSEYASLGWTPDDRAIAFIDRRSGVGNLWVQPLSGEPPHALTHFRSEGVLDFAWSLDGSRIAITRGDTTSDAVMITNF